MLPACPVAHLIISQTSFSFAQLETLFDAMFGFCHPSKFFQQRLWPCIGRPIIHLHYLLVVSIVVWRGCLQITDSRVQRHRQQIALSQSRQTTTKPFRSPHPVITGKLAMGQTRPVLCQCLQALLVTRAVPTACFGHPRAHVDGDTTVINFTQLAVPLPGDPHRFPSRFWKARGIEHQDAIGLFQVRLDLLPQYLSQGFVVPLTPADEALQRQKRLLKTIGNRFDTWPRARACAGSKATTRPSCSRSFRC